MRALVISVSAISICGLVVLFRASRNHNALVELDAVAFIETEPAQFREKTEGSAAAPLDHMGS